MNPTHQFLVAMTKKFIGGLEGKGKVSGKVTKSPQRLF
jgi:hypothetical protein